MSDYVLGKEDTVTATATGVMRWMLLALMVAGGALVGMAVWNNRQRAAAASQPVPAESTLKYTPTEICRGAVVVRIRKLDVTKNMNGVAGNNGTWVLVQPVGAPYLLSCTADGNYEDYFRAGQLVRLSMDAG